MITINSEDISQGWEKSFIKLYEQGILSNDSKIFKDSTLVLTIKNPISGNKTNNFFPMNQELIKEYNQFIISGGDRNNVLEEHALYHERIMQFSDKINNQLNYVIETLKKKPYSKRAQISFWDPNIDQINQKVPCIQIIWFRIENQNLVMHVHMRANDGYKKLLMNLNICSEIMKYVKKHLNINEGHYIHFVDSFHFYNEDKNQITELYQRLKNV